MTTTDAINQRIKALRQHHVEVVLLHDPEEYLAGTSWTDEENNRMFWLANRALQFLSDWGLFIHYPLYRSDISEAKYFSWLEAREAVRKLGRTHGYKTIFVCLRAESWTHEGLADSVGGDFALLSYRQQMARDGSPWWQMCAHELMHLLGAKDEYGGGTVSARCIMADLAQTVICDQTLREIGG